MPRSTFVGACWDPSAPKPAKSLEGPLDDPKKTPSPPMIPPTTLPEGAPWACGASQGTLDLQDQESTVNLQPLPEGQCPRTDAVVAGDSLAEDVRQLNLSSDGGRKTCGREIPTYSSTMLRACDELQVAVQAVTGLSLAVD